MNRDKSHVDTSRASNAPVSGTAPGSPDSRDADDAPNGDAAVPGTGGEFDPETLDVPGLTPGEQKVIDYFNALPVNDPVSLHEITSATDLSWTYVKALVTSGKFTIETKKSGKSWIAWKVFDVVGLRHEDSCQKYLKPED